MNALYDVPAPAKLNLFLHIVGRRADGYHLLQSAFMLIDWQDTLHFERRPGRQIEREDLTVALPHDDLITRAARLLQVQTGCTWGAHIAVHKAIPAQAGLGGGSSDAASCLLALNRLWDLDLSVQQLAAIGVQLGADVPFFLHGHNAWVEGIGEKITPIELPPAHFVVIKPAAGLETSKIFAHPDLRRDTKAATIDGLARTSYDFGHNDLQAVAEQICPPVSHAIERLAAQGLKGRMTGSGSAVFALLPQGQIWQQDPDLANCQVRVCSNLDVHPLSGWATSDN
jgi:4-diphosphocytidyl-2-C-methyl-D-erythritol kinase